MPESRIVGHVVSAIDHTPVSDVVVSAASLNSPFQEGGALAETDEAGEFSLVGLTPGSYVLRARDAHWQGVYADPVEVELGSVNRGVVIAVNRAARVSGRVSIEASDEPCRSGTVMLGPWPDPAWPADAEGRPSSAPAGAPAVDAQTTQIEVDGTVEFEGVAAGIYHAVVRCVEGFVAAGPRTVQVTREDQAGLSWTVSRGASVSVKARDEAGIAVAHATVILKADTPGATGAKLLLAGVTDATGSLVFSSLRPGHYEIRGNGVDAERFAEIDLKRGDVQQQVQLTLPGNGYIVASLRTASGAPADGLDVRVEPESAGVNAAGTSSKAQSSLPFVGHALGDGMYRIGPLRAGRYAVTANDGVNEPVKKSVVSVASRGTTQVNLTISCAGSISGRVVDEGGAPVENAWVSAAASGSQPLGLLQTPSRVLSDAEGRFTLGGLAERGSYSVRAEKSGGGAGVAKDVRCAQSADITIPTAMELRGSIMDGKGQPPTVASVRVRHLGMGTITSGKVDSRGEFEVRGLTPGGVQVQAITPSGQYATLDLELSTGNKLAPLRLVLTERGSGAAPPADKTAMP